MPSVARAGATVSKVAGMDAARRAACCLRETDITATERRATTAVFAAGRAASERGVAGTNAAETIFVLLFSVFSDCERVWIFFVV